MLRAADQSQPHLDDQPHRKADTKKGQFARNSLQEKENRKED